MNEIDIKMGYGASEEGSKKKTIPIRRQLDKNILAGWIENCLLDNDTKKELIKELQIYPSSAVNFFYDNIRRKVEAIRNKKFNSNKK